MAKNHDQDESEAILEINELKLDKALYEQPKLASKWLKKLAKARFVHDTAKAELELTEAELAKKIRESPEDFELEKITENAIADAVVRHEDYQEGIASVNKAKYAVAMLEATCTAIEHRKRALEKAVDLFGMEYFAIPRGEDSHKAAEEYKKKLARSKTKPRRERDDNDE